MQVYRYDKNKEYIGTEKAHLDPLETKKQGHDVYLLPANATFEKPIDKQEGKAVIFKNGGWVLVDDMRGKYIIKDGTMQQCNDIETTNYILTDDEISLYEKGDLVIIDGILKPKPQEQIDAERIAELKNNLTETDYKIIKIAEGSATKEEYAEDIIQRQAWRAEINELGG